MENGASVAGVSLGSVSVALDDHVLLLKNVLYLLGAYRNIISISSLIEMGYEFHFAKIYV